MKVNKQKLEIAMANNCLAMDELATKVGISRVALTKYKSGKSEPRPKVLGMIARALNVQVEDLIDLEDVRK